MGSDIGQAVMGMIGGLTSSVAGPILGGLWDSKNTRETNQANMAMNRENNATNLMLNEKNNELNRQLYEDNKQWQMNETLIDRQREDTAVQRRMKDLEMAGINPLMAGMQGASSSQAGVVQPIPMQAGHTQAGRIEKNNVGNIISGINLQEAILNQKMTKAQINKIEAETKDIEEDTTMKQKSNPEILKNLQKQGLNISAQTENLLQDTKLKETQQWLNSAEIGLTEAQTEESKTRATNIARNTLMIASQMEYLYQQSKTEVTKQELNRIQQAMTQKDIDYIATQITEKQMDMIFTGASPTKIFGAVRAKHMKENFPEVYKYLEVTETIGGDEPWIKKPEFNLPDWEDEYTPKTDEPFNGWAWGKK